MVTNPERFRLYRLFPNGELKVLATAATLDDAGYAIGVLASEGELEGCTIGILDRPVEDGTGSWVLSPFGAARG